MVAATGSGTKATGLQSGTGAAGGAPATGNTSKGGASASSSSKAGGGKMGASSSQSGGVKSSAGAATGSTSKGSTTSSGKIGPSSSQTGGPKGSGNARGPAASLAAAAASSPSKSKSTSNTAARGPAASLAAAGNNRTANTLAAAKNSNSTYSGPKGVPSSGLNPAARAAGGGVFGSTFRGPLGPLGELRVGVTPETRAYQNAEIARAAYPNSFGQYSQKQVTDFMNALASVTPFEADVNRYGTPALNPIARTAINQVLAGQQWNSKMLGDRVPAGLADTSLGAALAGLDTQKARMGTLNLNVSPSPPGTPMHTMADLAIGDALQQRGVPVGLMNANNFVAQGTPNVPGTRPIGTFRGTTYATDPTSGIANRVADANKLAASILGGPPVAAPANTGMPALASGASELDSKLAALQAKQPQIGPTSPGAFLAATQPREQVNGYLGGIVGPSMNMAGYSSPMLGLAGMPQAPSKMNMGGYTSPMAGLTGMPQAPSNMNMAGYQSPMAGVGNVPNGFPSPALGLGQGITPDAARQFSEFGASRPQPGPKTASNNPIGGMSFTPGLPSPMDNGFVSQIAAREGPYAGPPAGMPAAPYAGAAMAQYGMAPRQGVPGPMSPLASREGPYAGPPAGMPAAPADLAGYQNPGRSFAGIPSSGYPQNGLATAQPEEDPMERVAEYDPLGSIRAPKAPTTVAEAPPSGGLWGALQSGIGTVADTVSGAVEQAKPLAKTAWDNLDNPLLGIAAALMGGHGARRAGNPSGSNNAGKYAAAVSFGTNQKKRWKLEGLPPMGLAPPEPDQTDIPYWLRSAFT